MIMEMMTTYSETNRVLGSIISDVSERLSAGQLVLTKTRVLEGLEKGGKEGLQLLQDKKLSAEKAVVHVTF